MCLEYLRAGARPAIWLLSALALATAPLVAADADSKPRMSKEKFDRWKTEYARDSAIQKGVFMSNRLRIFERDREYVEQEVRKRVDAGSTASDALDEVVGKGRDERITKARQRLLEVHLPSQEDRDLIRRNFDAVERALSAAGFGAGGVHASIPFIESRYEPLAFNTASLNGETVKGMWQFTESTAKDHGLTVTRRGESEAAADTDERYDPAKSSKAAKSYLDMLEGYEFARNCPATEELVLASYHMGQGNANKKIGKYGCDFWQWRKDGEDGFGTNSYSYPALVLAGSGLLKELGVTP